MKDDLTTKVLLALQSVEDLSYKKKRSLIDGAYRIGAIPEDRQRVEETLGADYAERFFKIYADIDGEIDKLYKLDIDFLTYLDKEYPARLKDISDYPLGLFVKGNVKVLNTPSIGIVGSRKSTAYGEKVAAEFAREFALADFTVVSGFARGIDSVAHKACVASGKPTVAVFATGLDVCYPAENRGLLDGILMTGGAAISEYPLTVRAKSYYFPERNRIISGISCAVFLAQAAEKSGSLITVNLAVSQGRKVFCVPGNIYSAEAQGTNKFIKDHPESLALSPDDVFSSLGVKRETNFKPVYDMTVGEQIIVDCLRHSDKHFDELLDATAVSVGDLTTMLFNLELNGMIKNVGGNYYTLL